MVTRIQGSAVIADLPAEAAARISAGLGQLIKTELNVAGADLADVREEALRKAQIMLQQQTSFATAWHEPRDKVMAFRISGCLDQVLQILHDAYGTGGSTEVQETISTLQEAIIRRDA